MGRLADGIARHGQCRRTGLLSSNLVVTGSGQWLNGNSASIIGQTGNELSIDPVVGFHDDVDFGGLTTVQNQVIALGKGEGRLALGGAILQMQGQRHCLGSIVSDFNIVHFALVAGLHYQTIFILGINVPAGRNEAHILHSLVPQDVGACLGGREPIVYGFAGSQRDLADGSLLKGDGGLDGDGTGGLLAAAPGSQRGSTGRQQPDAGQIRVGLRDLRHIGIVHRPGNINRPGADVRDNINGAANGSADTLGQAEAFRFFSGLFQFQYDVGSCGFRFIDSRDPIGFTRFRMETEQPVGTGQFLAVAVKQYQAAAAVVFVIEHIVAGSGGSKAVEPMRTGFKFHGFGERYIDFFSQRYIIEGKLGGCGTVSCSHCLSPDVRKLHQRLDAVIFNDFHTVGAGPHDLSALGVFGKIAGTHQRGLADIIGCCPVDAFKVDTCGFAAFFDRQNGFHLCVVIVAELHQVGFARDAPEGSAAETIRNDASA